MPKPWIALDDDRLTSTQKLVYCTLCRFQGENEDCFPSRKTVAGVCRIHPATVKRCIDVLIKHRYIEKIPQTRPDGGSTSNRYRCLK